MAIPPRPGGPYAMTLRYLSPRDKSDTLTSRPLGSRHAKPHAGHSQGDDVVHTPSTPGLNVHPSITGAGNTIYETTRTNLPRLDTVNTASDTSHSNPRADSRPSGATSVARAPSSAGSRAPQLKTEAPTLFLGYRTEPCKIWTNRFS
jgi:hypothetical protein